MVFGLNIALNELSKGIFKLDSAVKLKCDFMQIELHLIRVVVFQIEKVLISKMEYQLK